MALLLWAFGPMSRRMAEVAAAPANATAAAAQGWPAPRRCRGLGGQRPPVFVDFTAAWCVTCQYNKKTTLANAEVLADLHAKNVALLRRLDPPRPAITAALAQLGRNGVPVYVFYRPGKPRWC